jgi:hypothetical protein
MAHGTDDNIQRYLIERSGYFLFALVREAGLRHCVFDQM